MRLIYGRLWFLLLKLMDEQVKEGKGFLWLSNKWEEINLERMVKIYPPQASYDEEEVGRRLLFAMVIDA
jgi:3-hydroxyacyl-CoA dehydrogenase/enoyl-CoA hydratase/3-hydroxybutyryl-CoA epimerase